MPTISGRMVVNTISGRYGDFNVGTLYSDMGDFVVQYDGLDEYVEGAYEGEFIIRRTYQKTRKFRVGIIIEPVAEIEAVLLDEAHEGGQEHIPSPVVDPVEEEIEEEGTVPEPVVPTTDQENLPDDDAADLFGALWPLGGTVKLDPTVGRAVFRQQRDYLKANGYRFKAEDQVWIKG